MPRMNQIQGNPLARSRSVERMREAAAKPSELELNHGPRSVQAINDHLRRTPLETIDRQELVDTAARAFGVALKGW